MGTVTMFYAFGARLNQFLRFRYTFKPKYNRPLNLISSKFLTKRNEKGTVFY